MANNRLYLVDDESGRVIGFAKSLGTWYLRDAEKLDEFLQTVDFRAAADGGRGTLRLVYEADIAEFVTAHDDEGRISGGTGVRHERQTTGVSD